MPLQNFALVQDAIAYLNKTQAFPRRATTEVIVYRLYALDEDTVRMQGFYPKADGTLIDARAQVAQGIVWISSMRVALSDVGLAENANEFVRLWQRFRDVRLTTFFIDESSPVFERTIHRDEFTQLVQE